MSKISDIIDDEKDLVDMDSLSIVEMEELKIDIHNELDEIDKKSVRALREGNQELLEKYEQRAQELRAKLQELS